MDKNPIHRIRLSLVAVATTGILASCGGGGGGAMSEADFCTQARTLDSISDVTPESLSLYESLTSGAPTAELRDAMKTLLPLVEKMATLDATDPDAFMSAMEEFNTDEVNEANTVLTDYLTNTCGLGDDGDSDGDTTGDSTDEGYDTGFENDAYNDVDWDALNSKIDELSPLYGTANQSGSGASALFPGMEISVNFDAEGDGLAFCNALLEWVNSQTIDTNVIIRVQVNNTDVVTRMADSDCMEL